MASYAFTDSDPAARRLARLAHVFAPSTLEFVRRTITSPPALIVDLGCGPGYTTHLLADLFPQSCVVGLDSSARYITLANRTRSERVSFLQHDITLRPFPVDSADLLFCRFLLTHLADPQEVILGWAAQLRPGGLLLMEELEAIRTTHPTFLEYLGIVASMLRHQANELYVGPVLTALTGLPIVQAKLRVRSDRVSTLPVSNAKAAGMFALNVQAWQENAFIQEQYKGETITNMEHQLAAIAQEAAGQSDITWELRQIALCRA